MALLSPYDSNDFIYEHIAGAPEGCYNAPIPAKYTLRDGSFTARDQGARPTCLAFAAAVMAKITRKSRHDFSPEWVYRNRRNKHQDGMHGRDAMQILHKIGIVGETDCPYQPRDDCIVALSPALYSAASEDKIESYSRVETIEGGKRAMLETGSPLVAIIEHYNSGPEFWQPAGDGQSPDFHAVLIVGFDESSFEVLNSWGSDWADGGYTRLPFVDWARVREVWSVQ